MYFWRIDKLKSQLRARSVPASGVLAYATAHLVLWTMGMFIPVEDAEFDGWQVVSMVASALIVVLGLRVAYKANGGAEGPDFAGRLLALGWVLGVRLIVLWLVLFTFLMILVIVGAAANREPSDFVIAASAVTFVLLASVVFFWRLAHHLKDLTGAV